MREVGGRDVFVKLCDRQEYGSAMELGRKYRSSSVANRRRGFKLSFEHLGRTLRLSERAQEPEILETNQTYSSV